MSIIEDDHIKYRPLFYQKNRVCDGPNCHYTGTMRKFRNSLGFNVLYCLYHYVDPYNDIGNKIHHITIPNFSEESYKIFTESGNSLCHFRECEASTGLMRCHNGHFCNAHAKEITKLHLTYANKDDDMKVLLFKLQEFNYRKILNVRNIEDIVKLEKKLNLDPNCYSKSVINILHYEYAYNNYHLLKNKNLLISSGSSGSPGKSETSSNSGSPKMITKISTYEGLRKSAGPTVPAESTAPPGFDLKSSAPSRPVGTVGTVGTVGKVLQKSIDTVGTGGTGGTKILKDTRFSEPLPIVGPFKLDKFYSTQESRKSLMESTSRSSFLISKEIKNDPERSLIKPEVFVPIVKGYDSTNSYFSRDPIEFLKHPSMNLRKI